MDFKNILAKLDAVDNTANAKKIAQPSKKDAMQSILESFDRVAEAAKPDFLDIDKDGDKKEPMKKAAKDKDKDENVKESKYPWLDHPNRPGAKKEKEDKEDKEEAKESADESPESMDNMNDEVHAENRIQELEDALEEIKAKIDELMSLNEAPILAPILGIAGRAIAGKAARKIGSAAVGAAMGGGDSGSGPKSTPAHLEPNRVAALKARESVGEGASLSPKYIKHLQLALRNWGPQLSRSETRELQDILDKLSIANIKTIMNADIPHLSQMAKLYLRNKTPGGMKNYSEAEVQSSDIELDEAIMVSAEGDEAETLLQILKLSGMPTPPAPAAMPAIAAPAADLDTMDIEMQDEYSNSPDEFEQDINAVIANGTDLHREKGQYPAAARGDNPMNAFEGKFKAILADLLKE
jgi:hypothetical protein